MSENANPNNDHWLQMAQAAASASCTYFDANIRAQIEADIRQFNGVHPKGSKYNHDAYKSRSRFFRMKTRAAIRKNEAIAAEAYFSTDDIVKTSAEDPSDPMQVASAEFMKSALNYRLTKPEQIPWFLILCAAYQEAQVNGIVISYQYWEYRKKKKIDKPCVELVPIENFRFDPNAKWYDPIGTSPFLIELMPMYVKDVKERMKPNDSGEARWKPLSDTQLRASTKPFSSDTIRQTREQGRTAPDESGIAITPYTIVWVHRNIVEHEGEDWVFYTLGTHQRLSDPRPIEKEYWHGKRPYVMGQCMIEAHKLYPGGLPRMTRDTQGEINEIANQRIDNVRFAMNKRYFARRSAQVDLRSLTRNAVSSVTLMNDPEKDVKIVETNDVTSSSYQEQDRLNLDFDDVAGGFSQSSVQSNRSLNETVGGMNILTRNANQVNGYQLRTFNETWVEKVLRQLVLLIQYYESDAKIIALAGRNAKLVQQFGINEVTDELLMQDMTLSVGVGMGATNPQDKVNNLLLGFRALKVILQDGLIERYGGDVRELIKELLGAVGFKDGVRFFPEMEKQDPAVRGLMEQVQQLQAAIDAKYPPELLEAQVKKLVSEAGKIDAEKVNKGVEASFSAMQAGQVIAATPQVAPVADEIMRAAGYQSPNPLGADPNFPTAAGSEGIIQNSIKDPRSGIEFTPPTNTNPLTPANPGVGVRQGIETQAPDSVIA